MATQQLEELQSQISAENLNIEALVSDATWKDLLVELVKKNKLNPWDIDIVEVVDKYVSAVHQMKVLDLGIPANIMLAAAMLVRFKSDVLMFEQQSADLEVVEEIVGQRPPVTVEPLTFRLRLPPKRRLSLPELIEALDEAMKMKEAREVQKHEAPIDFPIMIKGTDIEEETRKLLAEIKKNVDKSKMTTFSNLVRTVQTDDVLLELFIPLLFLAHKNRILLIQEKFFSDIIIALN